MGDGNGHQSTNLHKYTVNNPIYDYHLQKVLQATYAMVAGTRPRTLLDAGCGEGFVTDFVKRKDPSIEITGVDVSMPAIAYAREHFGEQGNFITGDLYDLPFEDGSFDTVLCSEVLEHLDHPERAARELGRVARRYVVITVPLEPYFQWLNNVGRFLRLSPDPGHVNFWTKQGFRTFIREQYGNGEFRRKHIYQLARIEL